MLRRTFLYLTTTALVGLGGRMALGKKADKATGASAADPLLAPWTGAHGGVPPFHKIEVSAFKPALQAAMDLQRHELAAIVARTAPPTFEDTIVALEDSGRAFGRVTAVFGIYTSTLNDETTQAIELEMAPVLAAFSDEITQNEALFARIKSLYDRRGNLGLDAQQARLLDRVFQRFARRGAALGKAEKARLRAINQRLASLSTTFSQNVLHDEERDALTLAREADLAGLPEDLRAGYAAAASARGLAGQWLVNNTRSAVDPFLTYSTRRHLREAAWRMFVGRCEHAGPHDNRPVITEILALRAERARLLGYPTHAHWIIADNTARTPDAAMALMTKVWRAAVARVGEEVADMQAVADTERAGHAIAPWDYRFYAEKVRKAKYDLDDGEVKPYLQLGKLRDALFWCVHKLYGLRFTKLRGVPVYHPDVSVYEVTRGEKRVGVWYFDPYAREGKRSGAWMSEYRTQERMKDAITPIVSNNANIVKGKAGAPVVVSWDDASTLFHEFGHALHGLLSSVTYPTLAGTNTLRDFVEFPSQLNEHWLATPEVLNRFALHVETGKPMPRELLAKIDRAKHFDSGFATVEYLASAIYDLEIHRAPTDEPLDPAAFEAATMQRLGCPPEVVMRHRPTQFLHIFSGDEYSAGYYAYLWADTLTADAAAAFVEAGSFYDAKVAKKLCDDILSVGNSIPPEEAFRRFRGRDVDADALMRDRGFPLPNFPPGVTTTAAGSRSPG
jgi:peptidyl-dipeptidase Dcp